MESFQQFIDLRCQDTDPERFAIALAIRYIRRLIGYGGSDIGRPDDNSALIPHHLEAFINRAVEITWKNRYFAQEWRRMQQVLPQVKEAWEKGQTLFQEALDRAKSDQEDMKYFSMIDFAVAMPMRPLPASTLTTLRSAIGRLMGICWHGVDTSLRIKKERNTWKVVYDDILL